MDVDLEALRASAEDGDPVAMWRYGSELEKTDQLGAERWLRRSAETGDRVGMRRLATFLGTSRPGESKEWYERASEAGDSLAGFHVANLIAEEDPDRARLLWEKAAEDGITAALSRLGSWWTLRNPSTAIEWYRRAAGEGSLTAMFYLARLLDGVDTAEAQVWRSRLETSGSTQMLVAMGLEAAQHGDPDQGIRLLERAAERGDGSAMALLFKRLIRSDRRGAWAWAQRAGQSDDPKGWTILAAALRFRRPIRSHRLLRRAAGAGDPHARGVLAARLSAFEILENRFRRDASIRQAQRREWAAQGAAVGNRPGFLQHAINLYFAGDKEQAEQLLKNQLGGGLTLERVLLGSFYLLDRHPRAATSLLTNGARHTLRQLTIRLKSSPSCRSFEIRR